MSFLSLWKRIFGRDSKSPREQFKESYSRGAVRKINPESFQEGRHDQEDKVVISDGREGEIKLEKYNPAEHIPDSLEIEPKEVKKAKKKAVEITKPKRARTAKGRYKGDDKSTPDVNEAWEGGKAPKKKSKAKKK